MECNRAMTIYPTVVMRVNQTLLTTKKDGTMFTKNQLAYLCDVSSIDDWTTTYFPVAVEEHFESTHVQLTQQEFQELKAILKKASKDDIWNLQMGLNHFNLLSISMFATEVLK